MSGIAVHRFSPGYGAFPRLVDVEAQELVHDGQRMWTLHRRGESPDGGALLSAEALAIATFFDGTRDLRGVQKAVYERYGQLLYVERLHELAVALNRAGLIDPSAQPPAPNGVPSVVSGAPTVRTDVRAAAHAGTAYPDNPLQLREALASYFVHPDGPGEPPSLEPNRLIGKGRSGAGRLLGVVVPHIDMDRGGPSYAHAYRAVAERSDADLFVVFGTAHVSPDEMFTLTRRHYDTPLGPVTTDSDAVAVLQRELGDALFRNESVHDEEHSIEFQAVFLKYLFERRPFTMLPVLCSSFYGLAAAKLRPTDEPAVHRFLKALARATQGRRVTYIAAADLSHVGRLYGDLTVPTLDSLRQVERRDLESLALVQKGNAEAFFDHVAPDVNTRRICGLTPIYMMMRATGGVPGRLVKYSQWFGEAEQSAVTYAVVTVDAP